MAQAAHAGVGVQVFDKVMNALLQALVVVVAELDQVDAQGGCGRVLGEVFGDAMPDDVFHRQHQDF